MPHLPSHAFNPLTLHRTTGPKGKCWCTPTGVQVHRGRYTCMARREPSFACLRTFVSRRRQAGEERDAHTSGVVVSRIVSCTYEHAGVEKREGRREVGPPSVGIPCREKDRQSHPSSATPSASTDHAFSTYRRNRHGIVSGSLSLVSFMRLSLPLSLLSLLTRESHPRANSIEI